MSELRVLLARLGVDLREISGDSRLRAHIGLDSTETVELENELAQRFNVAVDLWDEHDYTIAELEERIAETNC